MRHYATDLGCEYFSVTDKDSFLDVLPTLVDPKPRTKTLLLEAFTNESDESDALHMVSTVKVDAKGAAKNAVKEILGNRGIRVAKRILGRQ